MRIFIKLTELPFLHLQSMRHNSVDYVGNSYQQGNTYKFHFAYVMATFLIQRAMFFSNFFWDSLHATLNDHYKAWSYKKKQNKKIELYRKSLQKEPTVKRCPLTLDLNPFRSWVKGKHSIGREFQGLAVQGKKLLTSTSLQHGMVTEKSWNGDRKIMEPIRKGFFLLGGWGEVTPTSENPPSRLSVPPYFHSLPTKSQSPPPHLIKYSKL